MSLELSGFRLADDFGSLLRRPSHRDHLRQTPKALYFLASNRLLPDSGRQLGNDGVRTRQLLALGIRCCYSSQLPQLIAEAFLQSPLVIRQVRLPAKTPWIECNHAPQDRHPALERRLTERKKPMFPKERQ
jgi:hypothetical protein